MSEVDEAADFAARTFEQKIKFNLSSYGFYVAGYKAGAAWGKSQAEAEIATLKDHRERLLDSANRWAAQCKEAEKQIAAEKARSANLAEEVRRIAACYCMSEASREDLNNAVVAYEGSGRE